MNQTSAHGVMPALDEACTDEMIPHSLSDHEGAGPLRVDTGRPHPLPVLVFSHLRWHFITQRPQHLLTRAAQSRSVFFFEEPWMHAVEEAPAFVRKGGVLEFLDADGHANVTVVRPHFFYGEDTVAGQRRLLDEFIRRRNLMRFDRWYYTPMALSFSAHLHAEVTVFDCMDELSAFLGAPPELIKRERELFRIADVVFTGGRSIYEAKRGRHANVHLFPSSIDVAHFRKALTANDPCDQCQIAHPRAGFFGAIDERFDAALVGEVAAMRPDVHFIFIGPVVKIDAATLPQAPNLHFLGMKSYDELPAYLGGWDAALLPFAINESTRYISPTKTPEYLAAAKRVVTTAIRDVVMDYGAQGLVEVATTADEFCAALDRALAYGPDASWKARVDRKLSASSWDGTWAAMNAEMEGVRVRKQMQASVSLRLVSKKPAANAAVYMPEAMVQAASQ